MFQDEYFRLTQEQHKLHVEQEILRSKINQLRSQLKRQAVEVYIKTYSNPSEVLAAAFIEGYIEDNSEVINMFLEDFDLVMKSSEIALKLSEIEFKNAKLNG